MAARAVMAKMFRGTVLMVDFAGDNLRRLMTRMGLTIDDVTAKSGVDQRTIQGILDGSKRPHAKTLHRLAAALMVSPDEFFVDPARLAYRCFDQATNPVVGGSGGKPSGIIFRLVGSRLRGAQQPLWHGRAADGRRRTGRR